MADIDYSNLQRKKPQEPLNVARWGILIGALALAAAIAFGAVDFQDNGFGPGTVNGTQQQINP